MKKSEEEAISSPEKKIIPFDNFVGNQILVLAFVTVAYKYNNGSITWERWSGFKFCLFINLACVFSNLEQVSTKYKYSNGLSQKTSIKKISRESNLFYLVLSSTQAYLNLLNWYAASPWKQ